MYFKKIAPIPYYTKPLLVGFCVVMVLCRISVGENTFK